MAQTPRTGGIVIRERVEVTPSAGTAGPARRTSPDPCAAPAVAEYVLYNPTRYATTTRSYGAPIAGTVTATSPCGTVSGGLAGAFTLNSFSDPIYYYESASDILRVPLSATAPLPAVSATVAGYVQEMSYDMRFGCTAPNCAAPPGVLVGAAMSLSGYIDGRATGHTYAWPDTVACGTTTPLAVTLVKADGTEGYVGPSVSQTFQLPGWNASTLGAFVYDGASGGTFSVPYEDGRAGAIAYAAPSCSSMTAPTGSTVWVTGLPGGTLLSDHITVLPEPPAALRVVAAPDTLARYTSAYVYVAAVTASGAAASLPSETPVTLSASGLGEFSYQRHFSSNSVYGATITIPYAGATGQAGTLVFTPTGAVTEDDTLVTVTATGGGLSGDTGVVVLGRLRLDLDASPGALPNGGASRLYATVRGTGASSVPTASTLTFTLADPSLGTLYRQSTRETGRTLTGVSRSAAAQGDVVFNRGCSGPTSPGGTAHITAVVDGWADLADQVDILVGARLESDSSSAAIDTLYVSFSPSALAPGDSAVMHVSAPETGNCGGGGGVLPDSTMMSVVSFPGPFGFLEHNGIRSRSVSNVTWGELKAGEVQFIATGTVPCAADTVGVLVSGPDFMGAGSVVVQGSGEVRAARSADAPMCTSRINLVESTEHLSQALRDACPRLAGFPADSVHFQYERTLTEYLFGGMGWGSLPEYTYSPKGLDGYLRWGVDTNGRRYPQVGMAMEAKMTNGRAVVGSQSYRQALNHINFLADQRTAFRQAFLANNPNGITFTFGDPTLIYVSQKGGAVQRGGASGIQDSLGRMERSRRTTTNSSSITLTLGMSRSFTPEW